MDIEEKVISIINDVLGVEVNANDTFEDLCIDSIDLVNIIINCEEEFCCPITDNRVQNLKTVSDVVSMIKDLVNNS